MQILSEYNRASVEGLNLLIKHMRPRKQGEQGQRIEFPAPINLSNLALICPKCSKPTRIGHKIVKRTETILRKIYGLEILLDEFINKGDV